MNPLNEPSKLSKLVKKAKFLGVGGICTLLARRVLTIAPGGKAFREFLVVLSEPQPTPQAIAAASNHTFRLATLGDLEALVKDPSSNLVDRDIEAFNDGNSCMLQLDGNNLVGYTWIAQSSLIDVGWGFHLNLPDDVVYNYNGYTTPAYRGTAFQALRHLKALEHVRTLGKRRILGYVDHLNFKALRGGAKGGYRRIGVLRGIRRNGKIHFSLSMDENSWSLATRAGPRHALLDRP